jgi:hypothetical protein
MLRRRRRMGGHFIPVYRGNESKWVPAATWPEHEMQGYDLRPPRPVPTAKYNDDTNLDAQPHPVLADVAIDLGINPSEHAAKSALVRAIREAQARKAANESRS